ncbi:putative reverse transcriptase domain-containing protein [Tanacetum coccineum]
MLVNALQQHKVEVQVNRMVEKVRGVEIKQEIAEVAKEMAEEAKGVAEVAKEAVYVVKKVIRQLQNLLPTIVAQIGNHVNNQGNNRNQDDNVINDNSQGNVRTVNNSRGGCSYKEFMACSLKDYDGKGDAIVYTRWIEKMESVQDMSGCRENQKVKYTSGSFIGKALTWWNFQVQTRGREAAVGMTWEDFKILTREDLCPNNEIQKLETEFWSLKKNTEERGNSGEPGRNGKAKDDNKRHKSGKVFATITNPVRKEYTGTEPKYPNCSFHHIPNMPCRKCTNCNCLGHFAKDCRAGPRIVTPVNARNPTATHGTCFKCGGIDHYKEACPRLNRAPRPGGNRPSQVMAIKGGQGGGNNGNQARGGAFMMGAEETRQDPNIVMGTFTLNNHFATTLFDSGADYSFVSTTFIPLLGIEPSDLGFSYDIKIASGQLVDINKVIRDCKLEIEGHIFDIDLIPFGHGSFDVIVGIDWLIRQKAEIVCGC